MKAPVKERIAVLRYKRLEIESYRKMCDALMSFLAFSFDGELFSEEVRNFPEVTIPLPTIGSQEPDWSMLKVSIDRQSRFWNAQKTRCVQFFRDYLTINCIETENTDSGRYEDLKVFFERMLPFLREHEKAFLIETVGVDYENCLTKEHLEQFLDNEGHALRIRELFRSFNVGLEIGDVEFVTPISQRITWAGQQGSVPYAYRVTETIDMPVARMQDDLRVRVLLSAASNQFPGVSSPNVFSFLDCMHNAVRAGFRATFTESALSKMGVSG